MRAVGTNVATTATVIFVLVKFRSMPTENKNSFKKKRSSGARPPGIPPGTPEPHRGPTGGFGNQR